MPNSRDFLSKLFVSVDSVVFGYRDRRIFLALFMRREGKGEPFPRCWSIPGGPVEKEETFEQACERKLQEDLGLHVEYLEQLYTFGAPDRDPRDRAVSVAYYALTRMPDTPFILGEDVASAGWFPIDELPEGPWAFDHKRIIGTALERLRGKLTYAPIGVNLLPKEFSLPDLKAIYEAILGNELDRRNFQKRILATELLIPTRTIKSPRGKPTQLYRFDAKKYAKYQRDGYVLSLPTK